MNCYKHGAAAAIGVCAHCGRGLCRECLPTPVGARLACSPECAEGLTQAQAAIDLLVRKSLQSLKASAFYCYLCGGLSAAAAIVAWFLLPSLFLILFTGACAVALLASGFWYGRAARRQL